MRYFSAFTDIGNGVVPQVVNNIIKVMFDGI